MERIILPLTKEKILEEYVERRISFTTEYAQLNIFDTTKIAEKITYQYEKPSILSMVTGRKVIWKNAVESYDFVPGETLVIPSSQKLTFDFPEANIENPTQCLTFSIDPSKIMEAVHFFNQNTILEKKTYCWDNDNNPIHLNYNEKVQNLIKGLVQIFTEEHPSKEMFADLAIKDLIVRLLQSNARLILLESKEVFGQENRLAFIVKYIQENLTESLTVDILADKACMSKSNFFKCFKNTFGITPLEYILSEKIKLAKKMLAQSNLSLDKIAFETGFSNAAYLIRQFKKHEQKTPGEYRNTLR
ncbi:helix-turn-helix domain-containing protein [Arcicella sp. LKC2W]|uniref:AraC family transcriptional regulator n=1 Tax=Arcicella sp. LKC2W TaxID=2984198 RepID=UPI002B201A7A|nr:helix-turn-helix domain-containing protein [Arcicella sp. LKC2W]MEA5461957.1 helix-turn-helix domain-containing protein [Arcicella sp. LKC2W]